MFLAVRRICPRRPQKVAICIAEVFAKVLGWTAWLTVSFFNDILDCISADLKLQMKRSDGAAMQVRQSQGENYFS